MWSNFVSIVKTKAIDYAIVVYSTLRRTRTSAGEENSPLKPLRHLFPCTKNDYCAIRTHAVKDHCLNKSLIAGQPSNHFEQCILTKWSRSIASQYLYRYRAHYAAGLE
ncbi:hypothetical protein RSOLAG1IB_10073 [Rhizoctonia solani AG-1 IB]|uniref:Uncharacterized protein n=1 Tax=Thanatephorus cucumeris (strain AG1-IB / isolate 7/3/14) TaxID=1108050 RepID=A0A0B7FUW2_THACB|nr:hypothetical protein RSOLAG1IB_10073 [Rhizoctonia solani AG-1 IB]